MKDIIVDLFAGGGGASTGIEAALGRPVDLAINHSLTALAVHEANHPLTQHLVTDVFDVDPRTIVKKGQRVGLLWASPDCTHFSVAKGGKPRKQNIRSLAEVVVQWADVLGPSRRPQVIAVENVREFLSWGPLYPDKTWRHGKTREVRHAHELPTGAAGWLDVSNTPIPERAGELWDRWRTRLELLGYVVDWRVLDASEYGAPTKRKRLFIIARCDGQPITWPAKTHGPGKLAFRSAAECIDWSIPTPSIFERKKPLAQKTLARIAAGIRRFVIETADPFIVKVNHGGAEHRTSSIHEPLSTVTASRRGHAVVSPTMVTIDHSGFGGRGSTSARAPLPTITTKNRHVLVTPFIANQNHSRKRNPADNGTAIDAPLRTILAGGNHRALVAPTLIQTGYGERPGQRPRTLDLHEPMGTAVAGGVKQALVTAFLAKHYTGVVGSGMHERVSTVTTKDHHSLVTATLGGERDHAGEVRAFLAAYYGSGDVGQDLRDPLRTVVTKARFGLVTVGGVDHVITDIGMRMLEPEELLRAQFGKFASEYDMSAASSKADKVRLIGNSVCPEVAEAVVKANLSPSKRRVAA